MSQPAEVAWTLARATFTGTIEPRTQDTWYWQPFPFAFGNLSSVRATRMETEPKRLFDRGVATRSTIPLLPTVDSHESESRTCKPRST
jgi:hypothetical protein